jgi:hypothetical protein
MKALRQRAAAPLIALAVTFLSVCAWWLLPTEVLLRWLNEGAVVEDFTVVLYLAAAAWLLLARNAIPPGVARALALTMAAFGAREADWHIQFTGTSMLRASFYFGPAPALHKAVSLAAVVVLVSAWIYLVRAVLDARRAHRLGRGFLGVNIVTVLGMLVATKLVDRTLSIAREDFGLSAGPAARALQLALEEPLEMVLPVLVWAAAWQYLACSDPAKAPWSGLAADAPPPG